MALIKTIIRFVIGGLLTAAFIMAGGNKLSDKLDANMHNMLSAKFRDEYAKIWQIEKFGLEHTLFRFIVGGSEVLFALLLWTPLARLASLGLVGLMGGAVATHVLLNEPFAVPAVLGGLSFLYFLLSASSNAEKGKKKKSQ